MNTEKVAQLWTAAYEGGVAGQPAIEPEIGLEERMMIKESIQFAPCPLRDAQRFVCRRRGGISPGRIGQAGRYRARRSRGSQTQRGQQERSGQNALRGHGC